MPVSSDTKRKVKSKSAKGKKTQGLARTPAVYNADLSEIAPDLVLEVESKDGNRYEVEIVRSEKGIPVEGRVRTSLVEVTVDLNHFRMGFEIDELRMILAVKLIAEIMETHTIVTVDLIEEEDAKRGYGIFDSLVKNKRNRERLERYFKRTFARNLLDATRYVLIVPDEEEELPPAKRSRGLHAKGEGAGDVKDSHSGGSGDGEDGESAAPPDLDVERPQKAFIRSGRGEYTSAVALLEQQLREAEASTGIQSLVRTQVWNIIDAMERELRSMIRRTQELEEFFRTVGHAPPELRAIFTRLEDVRERLDVLRKSIRLKELK